MQRRLLLALTVAASLNAADEKYHKTFLRSRIPGAGLIMRPLTSGLRGSASSNHEGVSLQTTPFYQWSRNEEDLGKYFGMFNDDTSTINDYVGVDSDSTTELLFSGDVIHGTDRTGAPADEKLRDQVELRPQRKVFGVRLDCCIDLGSTDQLQLRVNMPISRVKTSMKPRSIHPDPQHATLPGMATQATLTDYLAGDVTNLSTNYKQEELSRMKITGETSVTGVGDIDFSLSWCALSRDRGAARLALIGTIPTQKLPSGEYWFEPQVTNGGHVALGAGLYARFALLESNSRPINLFCDAEGRCFFRSDEVRAPHFKRHTGALAAWPLLLLGGETGQKGTFPLANKLTQDYRVSPGFLLDGILGVNFASRTSSLSIGYNLYLHTKEKVEIISWTDEKYAVVDFDYDTANNFSGTYAYPTNEFINSEHVDTTTAETPTQIVHRFFCSVSLQPDGTSRYFLGAGAFADVYSHNNGALKEIGIWARLGVNF